MSVRFEQKQFFTEAFEFFVTGIELNDIKTAMDFGCAVNELVEERKIPIETVHAALASVRSYMHLTGIWKQYVFAMQDIETMFLASWMNDGAISQMKARIRVIKNAPSKEKTQVTKLREQGAPKLKII